MNGKRPGHIIFLGSLQKAGYILNGFVLVMMAAVAGIGLLVQPAFFYSGFGVHEIEGMAVGVSCLSDFGHFGHMTTDAAAKGMNPVRIAILYRGVATFAQPVLEKTSL